MFLHMMDDADASFECEPLYRDLDQSSTFNFMRNCQP